MKKIFVFIFLIFISITLTACEAWRDFTEELNAMEDTLLNQIPEYLNADFQLSIDDDYRVMYDVDGIISEDMYTYVSPFYDRKVDVKVKVSRGTSEVEFTKTVTLLSSDSGHNHYQINIHRDIPNETIMLDTYIGIRVEVKWIKNGITTTEVTTDEVKLRGRGNSTWYAYPKKPYRMRFDKNTSIFGMPEAKNYVLLAEYADTSLMRNAVAHKMSQLFTHLNYAQQIRFIDLYIDDSYQGLYVLTEQVEVHPNKLYFETLPGVIDTGYFFELDMRFYEWQLEEGNGWFLVDRHPYEIKEPDPEDPAYLDAQAEFLQNYMYRMEYGLTVAGDYEEYLNVDNAIDFFLIHEISKNVDVGWSSVYMMKEQGGRIEFGPIWDFDFAFGNTDYIDYGPENWYGMRDWKNRLFGLMMARPEIRERFKLRYQWYMNDVLPELLIMIPILGESFASQAEHNFEKWPRYGIYTWPNPNEMLEANTHEKQIEYLKDYLEQRSLWILQELEYTRYAQGNFGD
ncbi:MAG: hypothetical protein C4537_00045 [Acholeplasma sp.]|jgi:hypothetical protein|nr:MAG: hypothetical protein C4537_00045 [Acholeplasma sp.]